MEHLLNDRKDHPHQPENSHKLCEFDGKSMENETSLSEFPNGGKAIVESILASY